MSLQDIPSGVTLSDFVAAVTASVRPYSLLRYSSNINLPPTQMEFVPDLSAQEVAAYAAVVASFATAQSDKAALLAGVANALTLADARIAQIAADRTALAAVSTLAQVRPIVDNELQAEAKTLAALESALKALRGLLT